MKRRVFVVDDEPIIADTLAAILNMNGYDASPFYDGEVVLAACECEIPACLISDVMMPTMNGIDLAIRVKQQMPGCRVLLFSGQAATFDMLEEARRSGFDFELLTKPVHPKDLLARLEMNSGQNVSRQSFRVQSPQVSQ